jgi:hypothetical protein
MSVKRDTLVDAFGDSIGIAKAEDMIHDAAERVGIDPNGTLTEDEAQTLLTEISEDDSAGTMVTVAANTVKTRLRTDSL